MNQYAPILTYFKAEKAESAIFIFIGVISLLVSLWFFFKTQQSLLRGIAIPVLLIGIIQVAVGSTVYFRTDGQIEEVKSLYDAGSTELQEKEAPRMQAVMKNFRMIKWIEVAIIVAGLVLVVSLKGKPFWMGIGLGMLLQGAIMITADLFAEKRGAEYLEWVENQSEK